VYACIDKQRQEKQEMKESFRVNANGTYIWGKNVDANRDETGRLLPRRRAIGGQSDETIPKPVAEEKYVSIVEKMSQTTPQFGRNSESGSAALSIIHISPSK